MKVALGIMGCIILIAAAAITYRGVANTYLFLVSTETTGTIVLREKKLPSKPLGTETCEKLEKYLKENLEIKSSCKSGKRRSRNRQDYMLLVEFTDSTGKTQHFLEHHVPQETWNQPIGSSIKVLYDKTDPEHAQLKRDGYNLVIPVIMFFMWWKIMPLAFSYFNKRVRPRLIPD